MDWYLYGKFISLDIITEIFTYTGVYQLVIPTICKEWRDLSFTMRTRLSNHPTMPINLSFKLGQQCILHNDIFLINFLIENDYFTAICG